MFYFITILFHILASFSMYSTTFSGADADSQPESDVLSAEEDTTQGALGCSPAQTSDHDGEYISLVIYQINMN